ncbi:MULTISPECIES: geranylgeranylglycerol-phosphate geranylgeranyltransferase [Halococcus]|uniref:Digeranylgeranylglyceryl phosphate synthase n=1 Tax=Halococcus salifodinae DSM 8989 TaxID=1227456 RepID=M0MZF2_9EURY|nr:MULTISPECIES: geranylgeranylglycerol-phosphate geranylgeranyltransferase [Halococcus]EMA49800.1 prenyltransferase [Halococcus salifodinae DSM 8989]
MTGERARGLFELTRPINAVAAGALTFIGAFVVGGLDRPAMVAAAAGATVLAVAAGNTMNDYFDREIDRINQPDRAIPRGAVTPREALVSSLVLFAGAVALSLFLPLLAVAIAVVNLLALVAYTELFKGLPGVGNAVVGYLGGSTFLFGAAAVGRVTAAVVVLFALAALSTVAREIVKDVEDLAGDREEGLKTLPIAVGERTALWLAVGLLAVALAASPLPYVQGTFGWPYLVVVALADLAMIYAAVESFADPTAGQEHLSYAMFLAAAAFVVGRVAVAL